MQKNVSLNFWKNNPGGNNRQQFKIPRAHGSSGKESQSSTRLDQKIIWYARQWQHLEYGNAIWGPNYLGAINMLEKIQRRATKMIIAIKDLTYGIETSIIGL